VALLPASIRSVAFEASHSIACNRMTACECSPPEAFVRNNRARAAAWRVAPRGSSGVS